ncbi:MAG: hypothetical protein R6X18_09560 [Chloroflexota bacterium]|jgi:hypothetical protein
MKDKPIQSRRDTLIWLLALIVIISLLVSGGLFARYFAGQDGGPLTGEGSLIVPDTGDPINPEIPGFPNVSSQELRELALALAALITAITGLLGLILAQVWRGREENRLSQTHRLALERERLEIERERLKIEKERFELEREKDG